MAEAGDGAPTFEGFPRPNESDGLRNADEWELLDVRRRHWRFPWPNRIFLMVGAEKTAQPTMNVYIRAERIMDYLMLNAAIRQQAQHKKSTGKNSIPEDQRIWFDITPSLHDTDLGLIVLARWQFSGFHGAHHLPDTGVLASGITVFDPFCDNDWRQLAWLAKFETLSAEVNSNIESVNFSVWEVAYTYGWGCLTEFDNCNFVEPDEDLDSDEEKEPILYNLEFEMFRRNVKTPQFVRNAQEIMRLIGAEMPEGWYRPNYTESGKRTFSRHRCWDAAVCAYNNPKGNILL